MEKTTKCNQEQKPKGLENSRYWENKIPKTEGEKTVDEGHIPDAQNPKRLKELH